MGGRGSDYKSDSLTFAASSWYGTDLKERVHISEGTPNGTGVESDICVLLYILYLDSQHHYEVLLFLKGQFHKQRYTPHGNIYLSTILC